LLTVSMICAGKEIMRSPGSSGWAIAVSSKAAVAAKSARSRK
jgi:hypothetical protein